MKKNILFTVTLLVGGLSMGYADNVTAHPVLITPPISAQFVGCYMTVVKNATVTIEIVGATSIVDTTSHTQVLANKQAFVAGQLIGLFPGNVGGTDTTFGYCKYTIHKGGRKSIRASACGSDREGCHTSAEAY